FLKQDYRRAAEVHLEAGYVPPDTDVSAFEDAMREIAEPIFNRALKDISLAELLFYLFSVTERFQMETRPELLLLQKTMVVIEGVARELEPDINVWNLARPLVTQWVAEHLGPKARVEQAALELRQGVESWLRLPDELRSMMTQASSQPAKASNSHTSGWPGLFGIILLAAGSGMTAVFWQQGFTAWQGPFAVLTAAIGAVLVLKQR
ncbi:MAG: 2-polyprenylphenol 6-hydroxylase, partial [Mariprofundaceae bacterium]